MVELQPVDAVEVTLVVDNYVDVLLAGAHGVRRLPLAYDHFDQDQLVAEHGFSALVTVESSGRRSSVLYDGGLTPDNRVLISGEVPRVTGFGAGFPIHKARAGDGWEPDPLVLDDQNLVVDVAGKGLVVVSACSPARAVNVLRNARRLTGRDQIAGFVGGFHLTGAGFEPIIEPTVAALTDLGVERFVPGHCTGCKATHRLAAALPEAFIQPSVGTVVRF